LEILKQQKYIVYINSRIQECDA